MRLGNIYRWTAAAGGGFRTQAIFNGQLCEFARGLSSGDEGIVAWFANDFPSIPIFFCDGREILASVVLEMSDIMSEIQRLSEPSFPLINEITTEQVADQVMLREAKERLRRIVHGDVSPILTSSSV